MGTAGQQRPCGCQALMAGSHVTAAVQCSSCGSSPAKPARARLFPGDPALGWIRWVFPPREQRVLPKGPLGFPQSSWQNRKADYWVQIARRIRWGLGMAHIPLLLWLHAVLSEQGRELLCDGGHSGTPSASPCFYGTHSDPPSLRIRLKQTPP